MSAIVFPYSTLKDRKVPIVPINIFGNGRWHYCLAFVDSGATFSIFKKDEAQGLGLEFDSGTEIWVVVGGGSYIPVYIHRLKVMIGEEEIEADIGFSDRLGVGFNLLGRKNIFDCFRVCFNDKEGIVSFEANNRQNS
ncbi:hypothetical protein ISS37_04045 [candidate division KSB1 bacterium]|nr:hypothetical protein [candidate division KSB1 bacterium]